MLEARRDNSGKLAWHFAFARACAWDVEADYGKQRVWSAKRIRYPLPQGFSFYQVGKVLDYPEPSEQDARVEYELIEQ